MSYRWMILGAVVACCASRAAAQPPPDVGVLPREVADEVLGVWNAPSTTRVEGPFVLEAGRTIAGDLAVTGGDVTIAGRVEGRVVAANGNVVLLAGARIDGDILVVGGVVTGTDVADVRGQVRAYRARLEYAREGDRLVPRAVGDGSDPWWRRRSRWRNRAWGDLRLVSARTYNRVEGLPVLIGPVFGRDFGWGRSSVDAYGVWRSADGFEWKSENVGHSLRAEVRIGDRRGVRLGGRLFDLVEPVESWHLTDVEVGLATFLLHRDYRDYFDTHGGSLFASVFRGRAFDATVRYSDERWSDRRTRDPFTLFRNGDAWRANPVLDEGTFHRVNGTLRFDTRNDPEQPWSGWFIEADYEYGSGRIARYGLTVPGTRRETLGGRTVYDRLFVDVRRYNRIAPDASLNLRLVAGGWLSGDDLPLQRRFSVGGPGSLPGYDFRRARGTPDVWQCSGPVLQDAVFPIGRPAQCERFALAQVEFRGDMHLDPFGVLDGDRDRRRAGWGRGPQWVAFADAGRGWMVGEARDGLSYRAHQLPRLSTFRTDVGLGVVLDNVGLYVAKSLSDGPAPLNVFVRLAPRF